MSRDENVTSTDPAAASVATSDAMRRTGPLPATAAEPPSPTASLTEAVVDPTAPQPPEPVRRRRRYGKRLTLTYRPVYPIRSLWLQASEEERRLAHERCTVILEYWVGIVSKKESAARLNVPPIRLWQMSQRAVSGMACALLKPPKTLPRRGSLPPDLGASVLEAESSPAALRKEIARLKRDLEQRNNLIEVLKSLPSNLLPAARSPRAAAEVPKPSTSTPSSGRAEHAAEGTKSPRGRRKKRMLSPPPSPNNDGEKSQEKSPEAR